MNKRKLLVIGGGSIHTFNIIDLIKEYFSEIFLITDKEYKDFQNINHKIIDFSFSNPLNIIGLPYGIGQIIKSYTPDLIMMIQIDTAAFSTIIANRGKIPTLAIALGSDVLLVPQKGLFYKFMVKFVLNRAKYFNTGAMQARDKMLELSSKELDILVASSGFEHGCKPAKKENIVYSNRLHKPLYRIPQIIDAFALFVKNGRMDWRLVIGATGNEDKLKLRVKELGIEDKVEFIGWVEKETNNHYYSISKIWVSIPESDNTPISLLEAMAAGCIPVMSDLISNKEWVEDGKNGIIVSDYDSNYIERALSLDYDKLVQYNLNLMETEGTKDANRKKFYSLFDKIFKE